MNTEAYCHISPLRQSLEWVKGAARKLGVDTRSAYHRLSSWSLEAAAREQDLAGLRDRCRSILPDVTDQYTGAFDRVEYERYWEKKLRGLHAFQVRCMLDAVDHVGKMDMTVIDIGDSSGNHSRYLHRLAKPGQVAKVVSVNLDPVAVDKVRSKGQEALLCRAEDLSLDHPVDLLMSFEMVEHLTDPARFLHNLASKSTARFLLMTVPYRARSRVALGNLRRGSIPAALTAEDLHIFEFSPDDWLLLARFAGWRPVFTRQYWQYPRRSPLRATAPLWKALDFEGFWGVLLEKDLSIADRYQAWG